MRFGVKSRKVSDRSVIFYNDNITIRNVPLEAYNYVISGKSAIEWIVDQYQVKVHKQTGIKSDPNDYAIEIANDPGYILKLLLKVINVSLETNALVAQLPQLNIHANLISYDDFITER